jgi:hypothetical protein
MRRGKRRPLVRFFGGATSRPCRAVLAMHSCAGGGQKQKSISIYDLSAHATNLFHGALARAVRRSQKSSKLDVR